MSLLFSPSFKIIGLKLWIFINSSIFVQFNFFQQSLVFYFKTINACMRFDIVGNWALMHIGSIWKKKSSLDGSCSFLETLIAHSKHSICAKTFETAGLQPMQPLYTTKYVSGQQRAAEGEAYYTHSSGRKQSFLSIFYLGCHSELEGGKKTVISGQ